jgi:hypothetical protein
MNGWLDRVRQQADGESWTSERAPFVNLDYVNYLTDHLLCLSHGTEWDGVSRSKL